MTTNTPTTMATTAPVDRPPLPLPLPLPPPRSPCRAPPREHHQVSGHGTRARSALRLHRVRLHSTRDPEPSWAFLAIPSGAARGGHRGHAGTCLHGADGKASSGGFENLRWRTPCEPGPSPGRTRVPATTFLPRGRCGRPQRAYTYFGALWCGLSIPLDPPSKIWGPLLFTPPQRI